MAQSALVLASVSSPVRHGQLRLLGLATTVEQVAAVLADVVEALLVVAEEVQGQAEAVVVEVVERAVLGLQRV